MNVRVENLETGDSEFLTDQEISWLLDDLGKGLEQFVEDARRFNMTKSAMLEFLSNRIDEIVSE